LTSYLKKKVIISGSGPSVFCLYRTRAGAAGAAARIRRGIPEAARKRWKVFVVRTENFKERVWRSPT
jgi:4-diphosphocytidyl-2C-methyl-D-erythritol kinase